MKPFTYETKSFGAQAHLAKATLAKCRYFLLVQAFLIGGRCCLALCTISSNLHFGVSPDQ